jgi:hypothetical protein
MTAPSGDLNFDRVERGTGEHAAMTCANCGSALQDNYFTANGQPICAGCRERLEVAAAPLRDPGALSLAIIFGLGASVVGAIVYYAVMRYANLEIGIVAVFTGWLVGRAMSKATKGRGGRLLQLVAVFLVYLSVALAYLFYTISQLGDTEVMGSMIAVAISALTLPIYMILGSMPSGLISAAIIGFGMYQAWNMTAAPVLIFEGPFKVGAAGTTGTSTS